jgi:hypothetical protein
LTFVGALGLLVLVALASALSGRLIVTILPLPRFRRCSPVGVAAAMVLASLFSLLGLARLSEWGVSAPRALIVLLAGHGVLLALVLRRRARACFRPSGPAAEWAALVALILVTALVALLPLPLTGGAGLGYDTFTYCFAGEWLRDHAFSVPAKPGPLAPVEAVIDAWQRHRTLGASPHALALLATVAGRPTLVVYPVASAWALVLAAITVVLAGRWALRLSPGWAWSAGFVFALLPGPATWAHHNGFLAQGLGVPGLVLGLAAMGQRSRLRDRGGAALVGFAAAYLLTVYVPFLALLGVAAAVWLLGGQRPWREAALRPAVIAGVVFLVAAGLDLRPAFRGLPSLVTAKVGAPVEWSTADWLGFATGIRAYLGGRSFVELSPSVSLAAAAAAVFLAAAGGVAAASRRSAHGLLGVLVVLIGLMVWYGGSDPWTGRSASTWSVFKAVKWSYPLLLLLQVGGAARVCRRLGREGAMFLLAVVLLLASAQLPWARGIGFTMREVIPTATPLRDAARIRERFRALPATPVVLLGRPASLSPWLAVSTALFAYPRPLALDWEGSAGLLIPLEAATAAYRVHLARLTDPRLVFVGLGLTGRSDVPVEDLGGPYARLLAPDRPQLAQMVEPSPEHVRTKLVVIAAKPQRVRIVLELLGPAAPGAEIRVIPNDVGGAAFHSAVRSAPVRLVTAKNGQPLELDLDLSAGQTTLVLSPCAGPGTGGTLRVGRVGVTPDGASNPRTDGVELVPEAGLEPARISPHAPQTCVSANSTTPARGRSTSSSHPS